MYLLYAISNMQNQNIFSSRVAIAAGVADITNVVDFTPIDVVDIIILVYLTHINRNILKIRFASHWFVIHEMLFQNKKRRKSTNVMSNNMIANNNTMQEGKMSLHYSMQRLEILALIKNVLINYLKLTNILYGINSSILLKE